MYAECTKEQTRELVSLKTDRYFKVTCGRNAVADQFRVYAKRLCDAQGLALDVERILFLTDTESAEEDGSVVGRVPRLWSDVLWQYTGYRFDFYVKLRMSDMRKLSMEKKMAAIYHELRHFSRDENGNAALARRHDVEEWSELAALGDWKHTDAAVPDLLSERVNPQAARLLLVPSQNGREEATA